MNETTNNDGLLISHIGRFDKLNHYYLISEFVKFFHTYKWPVYV